MDRRTKSGQIKTKNVSQSHLGISLTSAAYDFTKNSKFVKFLMVNFCIFYVFYFCFLARSRLYFHLSELLVPQLKLLSIAFYG